MSRSRAPHRLRCCTVLLGVALAVACAPPGPAVPPRVLLLLTVDTLRADRIGAYGADLPLTPHLDRLAAQSELFEHAYAPAAYTLPSVSALLTSRHPEETGMHLPESVLPAGIPTLAAALRSAGWSTGAVVSNHVLARGTRLDRGFDLYDDETPQSERNREMPERVASATTAAALRTLDALLGRKPRALLLWVHYQDPHGPYTPPEGYAERFLSAERARPDGQRELPFGQDQEGTGDIPRYQRLGDVREAAAYRAAYAGEVSYVDEQIGRLLEGMRWRGVFDEAVILFAADHGEGMGEQDYWFAHGEYLSDPLVRVPLLIRAPGRPPRRRSDVASLLDAVPTLCALLGIPPLPGSRGRDLLTEGASEAHPELYLAALEHASLPRFGLIADGYKYLLAVLPGGRAEQLYRIGEEGQDLAASEGTVLRRMRRRLVGVRRALLRGDAERRELDAAERDKLRALGYLE